jgi:chromosome partitioning protein
MIISVTGLKGGTGKSTIAQNLAVCFAHMGYKITIIDTDTNRSSERWSGLRSEELPSITVVSLSDSNALRKNIMQLHKNADIIVIDGTPSLSEIASTIVLVSDLVLIPVKCGALDIWATEKFLEKYADAKLMKENINAYFVVNQYVPRNKLSEEVIDVLKGFELPVLESTLHNRVAYAECVAEGFGVYEYRDVKAKEEIVKLTNEVLELLKK